MSGGGTTSIGRSPTRLGNFIIMKVPGLIHHQDEVVVTVDRTADVVVILSEFFSSDHTVSSATIKLIVVNFKCSQKFVENLSFGFLSSLHIWMELGIVSANKVVDVDLTISVLVKLIKSTIDNVETNLIHFTLNLSQELIVVDGAVPIRIKGTKESL